MSVRLITAVLFFSGCTIVRDPRTGVKVVETYGDSAEMSYSGNGVKFYARGNRHSPIIRAYGSAGGTLGAAAVSAITAQGVAR